MTKRLNARTGLCSQGIGGASAAPCWYCSVPWVGAAAPLATSLSATAPLFDERLVGLGSLSELLLAGGECSRIDRENYG